MSKRRFNIILNQAYDPSLNTDDTDLFFINLRIKQVRKALEQLSFELDADKKRILRLKQELTSLDDLKSNSSALKTRHLRVVA